MTASAVRTALAALVWAGLAGGLVSCKFPPPADVPDDDGGVDAAIDGTSGCAQDAAVCTAEESCLQNECVDCAGGNDRQSTECSMSTSPVCDASHDCRPCRADAECNEGVCDAGRCAEESEVIYMTPGGGGGACTKGAPCKDLKLALGLVTATKKFVSMANGAYVAAGNDVPTHGASGITATIVGHDSTLSRAAGFSGVMLDVRTNATLNVRALRIDADGADDSGVTCSGMGTTLRLQRVAVLNASTAGVLASCRLVLEDSRIENGLGSGVWVTNNNAALRMSRTTVADNATAGVLITQARSVIIANSIVSGNDGAQVSFAGIGDLPNSYFGFNTIADGMSTGIDCNAMGNLPIRNSIVIGNATQVGGCTMVFHTMGVPTSVPVIAGDPAFAANPPYHITSAGMADGAADPATALLDLDGVVVNRDVDGELRPRGALDVGADEIP